MPGHDWKALLGQWSRDLLASELAPLFPAEAQAAGWLGAPGATDAEIAAAEARLGTPLPPSYRAFLRVSNGWPMVIPLLGRLWPADEVAWFAERRPDWIDDWLLGFELSGELEPVPDEQYFVYGAGQDTVWIRPEYLRSALEISDVDERDGAIYLLNPEIVTPEGEWEAWYFANWLPGAVRYRSFWELMQAEYARFREVMAEPDPVTPEFLIYARDKLFSAQAAEAPGEMRVDLAGLASALEDMVERFLAQAAAPPGRMSTPRYARSVAEGVAFALERVRAIQAQVEDPAAQRAQLRDLVQELDRRRREGLQEAMTRMDAGRWLVAALQDTLDEEIESSGGPVGGRTAADIVRRFLDA